MCDLSARLDMAEPRLAAIAQAMGVGERARVLDGREPCLEEIGAKGDENVCTRQIERGNRLAPEAQSAGSSNRLVSERLVPHAPGAGRFSPCVEEAVE